MPAYILKPGSERDFFIIQNPSFESSIEGGRKVKVAVHLAKVVLT